MAEVMTPILQRWKGKTACLFVMIALAQSPVVAGVITLANGEVIDGTIQGRVLTIFKGVNGSVSFRVLDGKDILSIDQTGIRAGGESVLLVGIKVSTNDDVLQGLIFWNEGRRRRGVRDWCAT